MTVCEEEAVHIEEENLGLDLQPAAFHPSNKKFCAISGNHVISYDVDSGKRLKLFSHSDSVIGAYFIEKKFITITKVGTITHWDFEDASERSKTNVMGEVDLQWCYELGINDDSNRTLKLFVYGRKNLKCSDGELLEIDESSSDNSTCHAVKASLFRLVLEGLEVGSGEFTAKLMHVAELPDGITSKRQLSVGANFLALVNGCELKIIPLAHYKSRINGPLSFLHRLKYQKDDLKSIAFEEVHALDDALFVALNIGRLYFWSQIRECGLQHTNKTYIDIGTISFTVALTTGRYVFTGDGNSAIAKWNLTTTGMGRNYHGEYLNMAAPVECLYLNADATLLLATLADNSLYVISTINMTIHSRAQVLHWNTIASPLDWARLNLDSSQPEFLVTNGRLGHIQWIDPAKWKTFSQFDVSEENPPPRDHFNAPNYLWLNVYLVHLTPNYLIVCECRRNGFDKSYMKIYRRNKCDTMADFRLEEYIVCPRRVAFIRTNYDEVAGVSGSQETNTSEIIRVLDNGRVDVFVPDVFRVGRWRVDANRQGATWRKSIILSSSSVRSDVFATVNEVQREKQNENQRLSKSHKNCRGTRRSSVDEMDTTAQHSTTDDESTSEDESRRFVLLWQLSVALRIFQIIDCVPDVRQVVWAPSIPEGVLVLLIASDSAIFGYNPQDASLIWRVERVGLTIFSSPITCFAYDSKLVVFFNPLTGDVKKSLQFKYPQIQIVASGNSKNIRISGLSERGLCVLKQNVAENAFDCAALMAARKTPFSILVAKTASTDAALAESTSAFVQLETKVPSASKFFDGPAHTLAPLTQLAPLYVRSCLAPRRKD